MTMFDGLIELLKKYFNICHLFRANNNDKKSATRASCGCNLREAFCNQGGMNI